MIQKTKKWTHIPESLKMTTESSYPLLPIEILLQDQINDSTPIATQNDNNKKNND